MTKVKEYRVDQVLYCTGAIEQLKLNLRDQDLEQLQATLRQYIERESTARGYTGQVVARVSYREYTRYQDGGFYESDGFIGYVSYNLNHGRIIDVKPDRSVVKGRYIAPELLQD